MVSCTDVVIANCTDANLVLCTNVTKASSTATMQDDSDEDVNGHLICATVKVYAYKCGDTLTTRLCVFVDPNSFFDLISYDYLYTGDNPCTAAYKPDSCSITDEDGL